MGKYVASVEGKGQRCLLGIKLMQYGPKPLPVQAWLLRRKNHLSGGLGVYDVPYCQFVLEFDNFSFQIVLPNYENDAILWNRTVYSPAFVSTFDYFSQMIENRETSARVIDFSSKDKVAGEVEIISMHADSRIEKTDDLKKSVEQISKREGVKPLKPSVKNL